MYFASKQVTCPPRLLGKQRRIDWFGRNILHRTPNPRDDFFWEILLSVGLSLLKVPLIPWLGVTSNPLVIFCHVFLLLFFQTGSRVGIRLLPVTYHISSSTYICICLIYSIILMFDYWYNCNQFKWNNFRIIHIIAHSYVFNILNTRKILM